MSREELINKAAEFLSDPRILKSPEDKKRSYLKSKGLTDEEINIAIQRTGTVANSSQQTNMSNIQQSPEYAPANNYQPQYMSTPNNKFYTVSKAQLMSLSHRIPSFGSLILVFFVCYGIGAAITHLIKYTIKFWWPKSNAAEERLHHMEQKIENTSRIIDSQVNEMKDIVKTLKTFLESHLDIMNSNIRYDSLKKRQESSDESELKKDINLVRFLLSTVGTINRMKIMSSGNNLESYDEVKNEIDNVKGSIKKAFQGSVIPSVKSRSITKSDKPEPKQMDFPSWMKEQESKIPDWQKDETTVSEKKDESIDDSSSIDDEKPSDNNE